MKKFPATTIAPSVWEKSPAVYRTEIEALAVLAAYFSGINLKSKRRELLPKTSIRNPERGAIEPLIFPMNRRLYSNPAIAVFERELLVSSPSGFGVSAPAAQQRSAPASSAKPSVALVLNLLPHENEHKKVLAVFPAKA